MNKLVLVSGIDVSDGGVGRLMRQLKPEAERRGYRVIARRVISISSLIRARQYFKLFLELINRLKSLIIFKVNCQFVRNDVVLALYPQTIGYKTFLQLIKRNKVYLYVMDNNYFCMMSYNYDVRDGTECLKCLKNPKNVAPYCYSWPTRVKKNAETKYLEKMIANSQDIHFLAQTNLQKELIHQHFGPDVFCAVVGMDSGEVTNDIVEATSDGISAVRYDLVYHGSHHPAKGFLYILKLSKLLPNIRIFIPYSKEVASKSLKDLSGLEHVEFSDCIWETGLKQAVENSKLVINPSIWSAPIEGALLKSLAFNGNVASIDAKYGFQRELIDKGVVWGLPNDPIESASIIQKILNGNNSKTSSARTWLREFLKTNRISNVFEVIEISFGNNMPDNN